MDCWSGAKILCDFWDTKINTDNIILTTRYRSEDIPGFVADPEEIKKYVHELVNNAHMAATGNKIRDTILINQKFDYLYAENGRLKAVVVDNNGEPQVTDVTPDKPYSQSLITDGQGDTLVVSKKGQVMGVKEYKFAGDDRHLLNEYHRQLDSLGEWQINFTPAKNQTYAFDYIGSGNHGIFATDECYPKSGSYDFRYKSVECGKSDKVIVDFGSYPEKDSVIFKDKYGVKLKVVDGNILSFTGVSKADTNFIYAYRGDKKIGKLFLNTYQPQKYQVVFVKVNKGAPKLKEKEVKEYLNKVYNQCAVQFEIISTDTITIKDLTTFSHGGSGILTVYNEDQKKVLRAYDNKMQDGIFYLFFIDNVTDKKDGNGTPVSGYMPRGYNAGFIYDGGSPHTIAHELGHGIAGLEHVFENSNNSGKTANLMDYSFAKNAEELWHFQWDQIQDPSRVWMKWNKDESEDVYFNCVALSDELKKIRHYLMPNGTVIQLPDNLYPSGFVKRNDGTSNAPIGSLASVTDGKYDYKLMNSQLFVFGYNDGNSFVPKYDLTPQNKETNKYKATEVKYESGSFFINDVKVDHRNCVLPPEVNIDVPIFFVNSQNDEYVRYAKKQRIPTDTKIYDNKDIINSFLAAIKSQQENRDEQDKVLGDRIADKLRAYKELNGGKRFIVVKQQVNTLNTNQRDWNKFAENVFEAAKLTENDILITMPYVTCEGYGGYGGELYFMPGLYYGGGVEIDVAQIQKNRTNTYRAFSSAVQEIIPMRDFVMDVFKWTKKNSKDYVAIFSPFGSIQFSIASINDAVGYDYSRILRLQIDSRFSGFMQLLSECYSNYLQVRNSQSSLTIEPDKSGPVQAELLKSYFIISDYLETEQDIEPQKEDYTPVKYFCDIKEEYLDELAEQYVKTDAFKELYEQIAEKKMPIVGVATRPRFSPESEQIFGSKWDYLMKPYDDIIYSSIDYTSVILGCVGLDFVPDFIGMVYSLSRQDYANTVLYGAMVVIEGPEGKVIKESFQLGKGRFLRYTASKQIEQVNKKSTAQLKDLVEQYYKRGIITEAEYKTVQSKNGMDLKLQLSTILNKKYKSLDSECLRIKKMITDNSLDYFAEYLEGVMWELFYQYTTPLLDKLFGEEYKLPEIKDVLRNIVIGGITNRSKAKRIQKLGANCIQNITTKDVENFFNALKDESNDDCPNPLTCGLLLGGECVIGAVFDDFFNTVLIKKITSISQEGIDLFFKKFKFSEQRYLMVCRAKFEKDIDAFTASANRKNKLNQIIKTDEGCKAFLMLKHSGIPVEKFNPDVLNSLNHIVKRSNSEKEIADLTDILNRYKSNHTKSYPLIFDIEHSGMSVADYVQYSKKLDTEIKKCVIDSKTYTSYIDAQNQFGNITEYYYRNTDGVFESIEVFDTGYCICKKKVKNKKSVEISLNTSNKILAKLATEFYKKPLNLSSNE